MAAAPMRSSSQEAGHRARVADSKTGNNATSKPDSAQQPHQTASLPNSSASSCISTVTPAASTNFEYDDNEWDIGIGDLIIDLDADIEKNNDGSTSLSAAISAHHHHNHHHHHSHNHHHHHYHHNHHHHHHTNNSNISTSGSHTHHQVINSMMATNASPGNNNNQIVNCSSTASTANSTVSASSPASKNTNISSSVLSSSNLLSSNSSSSSSNSPNSLSTNKMAIEHSATVDKGLKMKIKRTKPGTKSSEAKHEIVKTNASEMNGAIGGTASAASVDQTEHKGSAANGSNILGGVVLGMNPKSASNPIGSSALNTPPNTANANHVIPNCATNTVGSTNTTNSTLSNKRGSSGHRRDKVRDKHNSNSSTISNILVGGTPSGCGNSVSTVPANPSSTSATVGNCSTTEKCTPQSGLVSCGATTVATTTGSCTTNTLSTTSKFTSSSGVSNSNNASITSGVNSVVSAVAVTGATGTTTLPFGTTSVSSLSCVNSNNNSASSGTNSCTSLNSNVQSTSEMNGISRISSSGQATVLSQNSGPLPPRSTLVFNPTSVTTTPPCLLSGSNPMLVGCGAVTALAANIKVEPKIGANFVPVIGSTNLGANMSVPYSNMMASLTDDRSLSPTPCKKIKLESKEMADVCVGTSVGTITEPDCLGPCEPGTSVTLEGIVWHETEGGVLVVNVTWRGKTYVGTLLDCTRHDWAPPRFCDSPTSDMDSRTPKGRETRSSVNSKLRNGTAAVGAPTGQSPNVVKGRRGAATATTSTSGTIGDNVNGIKSNNGLSCSVNASNINSASTNGNINVASSGSLSSPASPTPFVPPRIDNKRKARSGEEDSTLSVPNSTISTTLSSTVTPTCPVLNSTSAIPSASTSTTSSCLNPAKKQKLSSTPPPPSTSGAGSCSNSPPPPPATSPVLLECPEPNCSKKYKHINGLKYHQSHAHGNSSTCTNSNSSSGTPVDDEDTKDVPILSENDESNSGDASNSGIIGTSLPGDKDNLSGQLKSSSISGSKSDQVELPLILRESADANSSCSQPPTPRSTPSSPETPQSLQELSLSATVNSSSSTTSASSCPSASSMFTSTMCTTPVSVTNHMLLDTTTSPMNKNSIVKPGLLRFNSNEDYAAPPNAAIIPPVTTCASVYNENANQTCAIGRPQSSLPESPEQPPVNPPHPLSMHQQPLHLTTISNSISPDNSNVSTFTPVSQSFYNQLHQPQMGIMSSPYQQPPPTIIIPTAPTPNSGSSQMLLSPTQTALPYVGVPNNSLQNTPLVQPKLGQFKVKSSSSLMPLENEHKKVSMHNPSSLPINKLQTTSSYSKKKNRKSPAGSPHPPAAHIQNHQGLTSTSPTVSAASLYALDHNACNSSRDEVQSPAYSDISDDGAPPILDTDLNPSSQPGIINPNPSPSDYMQDPNKGHKRHDIPNDKKTESGVAVTPIPHIPQYPNLYHPFYSQPQYLMQQPPPSPAKQLGNDKNLIESGKPTMLNSSPTDKDHLFVKKEDYTQSIPPTSQKVLAQHYYPYSYMPPPGYHPYNLEHPTFAPLQTPPSIDDKLKDEQRIKESPSPKSTSNIGLQPSANPIPNPIQVPNPSKMMMKNSIPPSDVHLPPSPKETKPIAINDNHQILKESIEIKNQMSAQNSSPYNMYNSSANVIPPTSRPSQQEDARRNYYMYDKSSTNPIQNQSSNNRKDSTPVKSSSSKSIKTEKEDKKPPPPPPPQEGVKPTMETQGPPPPPTSATQYAYAIHPGYMQSAAAAHYGALPFDPNHPMYRGLMVAAAAAGNPYSTSPYHHPLHHQIPPRYHAPEDLSRAAVTANQAQIQQTGPTSMNSTGAQPSSKALDMLQHHAQYYSAHKIHELQERALKSPTQPHEQQRPQQPPQQPPVAMQQNQNSNNSKQQQISSDCLSPTSAPNNNLPAGGQGGKQISNVDSGPGATGNGKDSRSPPPQRHVHTHHHTHVGLGYPMYPAPYGATVLASQPAPAVTVINPYPTK